MAESGFVSTIRHKSTYQKIQVLDMLVAMMMFAGNFVCFFQFEHEYHEKNTKLSIGYLIAVMCMTSAACVLTFFKTKLELELKILEQTLAKTSTLYSSGLYKRLLANFCIYLMQPYPFFIGIRIYVYNTHIQDYIYYHLNDFFHLAGVFRLFFMITKIISISSWRSNGSARIW